MVPAFIPEGFTEQELRGVWNLIGLVKSYDQIFGQQNSEKSLAKSLDMILTSVGPAERPLGFGKGILFETGSVTFEDLCRIVIGDIGGVCFERPDLSDQEKQMLRDVEARWTGLRKDHLVACAARARRYADLLAAPPGVVIISGGRERAQFIYEIVKRGLVNHLIIDDELEKEMEAITQ
jgi:hypothetical protein